MLMVKNQLKSESKNFLCVSKRIIFTMTNIKK